MKVTSIFLFTAIIALAAPWAAAEDDSKLSGKLLMLAAASTAGAVEQIRAEFVRLHPGVTIRTSFAGSSTLARQITAGGDADLFLSASEEWADFLQKQDLIDRRRALLGNELVIITPLDSKTRIQSPADLAQAAVVRLALADPKSVPAGVYARQALEALGLWKSLAAKTTGATDVRQALQLVESGAAEAGIVYATDAAASRQVRVVARIEVNLSEPIRYPLVLLKHGAQNRAAVAFYEFLTSAPTAAAVFRRHGFLVLDSADKAKAE